MKNYFTQSENAAEQFQQLKVLVEKEIETFTCTTPAGGLGPGTHCAACCYGTGVLLTSREEQEYYEALVQLKIAMNKEGC